MTNQFFGMHPIAEEGYEDFIRLCEKSGVTQEDFDIRPHPLDPEELIFTYQRRFDLLQSRGDDVDQIGRLIRAIKRAGRGGRLNWAVGRVGDAEIQFLLLESRYLAHIIA